MLSVEDLRAAERALDPWIRQVTPYDEYLLEENLEAGGRFRLERPSVILYLAVALVGVVWLVVPVAFAVI